MRNALAAALLGLTLLASACSGEEEGTTVATAPASTSMVATTATATASAKTPAISGGASVSGALSPACVEWAQASSKFAGMGAGMMMAPGAAPTAPGGAPGAVLGGNLFDKTAIEQTSASMKAAVDAAPAAIKADMQVIQTFWIELSKIAETAGYDATKVAPTSPEFTRVMSLALDPKFMQASQNIATWTAANCGGAVPAR